MPTTNRHLISAALDYFDALRIGGATGERSTYVALANLLDAVGGALRPKVFCVTELADQGAGHPDMGLYSAWQIQPGRPRQGQTPVRGWASTCGARCPISHP